MIYAIRAVGTEFVKFGKAASVGKRLRELETGCPHELNIEAVANWPDPQETAIHCYLAKHCEKYEWFRDSVETSQVIELLKLGDQGLRAFRVIFLEFSKLAKLPAKLAEEYEYPSSKPRLPKIYPRVGTEPVLELKQDDGLHDRYESIKQRVLAKQAAKRRQETIS